MKILAVVLFIPALTFGSADNNGRGTKAIALANAFVAVADNPWAVSYNSAGLAQLQSFQASAFYIPQQFGLTELRTTAVSAAYCIHPGTVGVMIDRFGFDLYHSTDLSLGYGLFLSHIVAAGVAVNVEHRSIDRYGTATSTTLDIGILGWPTPDLALGFAVKNATAATIGARQERLPQYVLFGASYCPLNDFLIVAEAEKDVQFPLVIKAGLEQTVLGFLSLRCGIANNPDKFSCGIGLRYAGVEFGYAGYSHADLGWTHQIELTVRWSESP